MYTSEYGCSVPVLRLAASTLPVETTRVSVSTELPYSTMYSVPGWLGLTSDSP